MGRAAGRDRLSVHEKVLIPQVVVDSVLGIQLLGWLIK